MPQKKATKSSSKAAARSAVAGGGDVRKRVRNLTVRAVRDRDLSVRELPALAAQVIQGAAAGLDRTVPKARGNVLRQVVDGLTDAVAAAAGAARTSAASAGKRGAEFVRTDARRTVREAGKLEEQFLDSISRAGRKLGGAAKEELQAFVSEARRAGTKISVAAGQTRAATDGRIVELGRETANAGIRAARKTVGTLLSGASGLLEGLADTIAKPKPAKKETPPSRGAAGRTRTTARRR